MATKMTYVDALTSAIDFLSRNNFDAEVVEKLEACKASYQKRNSSKGERKPSKKQLENEGFKVQILDFLMEDPNLLRQAKDVGANFGKSSQWASALLRQMVEAGTVEKVQEKRTTYFKAVSGE
jgi:hypothetical protein